MPNIELKINKRVNFNPKQFGAINTITEVTIPKGCVGFVAIRQRYGNLGLINTSPILWPEFKGTPVIYAANLGGTLIELIEGEAIAHVAIVSEAEYAMVVNDGIYRHLDTSE